MPKNQPAPRAPRNIKSGSRLSRALVSVPLLAGAGWLGRKASSVQPDGALPQPVPGERFDFAGPIGRLAGYVAGPARRSVEPPGPLLLVHSINAAASAYEVRPIFEHYAGERTVYAIDLPGYGLSERPAGLYTPRVMTDAVLAAIHAIRERHGPFPIDVMALSLSCEFLARAASEHPGLFRTVALVSPTGFDRRGPRLGPEGTSRGIPAVYKAVTVRLWRRTLFSLLTSHVSIRYFLEKTFGSKAVDEGLVDYDYLTAHQPGAEHAPYSFISGFLFSADVTRLYDALQMPVWMVHGTRGDFQDYTGQGRFASRPNWTIDEMATGALPHFDLLVDFVGRYDAFNARHVGPSA